MFDSFEPMKKLNDRQIEEYLERIHYSGSRQIGKQLLDDLVWHHQCAIPFETIDCHDLRIGVNMEPDVIFEKIVHRRRGGHCLELNGSFLRLLNSLGFDARPCMSRVLLGTDEFTHPIDHRTSLVTIDGHTYYCDVGLGGPMPPAGLDIDKIGWQDMHGDSYAVEPSPYNGWYFVCRKTKNGNHHIGTPDQMRYEIMFTPIRCFETDFIFENNYMSFHPDALHVAHRIVNLRTPDGYRVIQDDIYREIKNDIVTESDISGNISQILREKFGIEVEL